MNLQGKPVFLSVLWRKKSTSFQDGDAFQVIVLTTREKNIPWVTFGPRSKKGHPHHPLYLRKDSTPEPFDVENYLNTCFE